jgi:soluble lytic murein transglycosylase-like protein
MMGTVAAGLAEGLPAPVARWAPMIAATARRHGVDPHLVAVVVWCESGGRPSVRSPIGARGLMQLMPATAAAVARRAGLAVPSPDDLDDPARNLDLGVRHLAELLADLAPASGARALDVDTVHLVAAAYNGGLSHALAYEGGAPLREETAAYAALVAERWRVRIHHPAK